MHHPNGTLCVGCLVTRGDEVLLVRHAYGPTKGRWDFPRGHVEADEPLEAAAVREVREETAVSAIPVRIVALRDQVGADRSGEPGHDVLVVWHLTSIDGQPNPDGTEVSDATFMKVSEALSASDVNNWTKELLRSVAADGGLTGSAYAPGNLPDSVSQWKLFTVGRVCHDTSAARH